MKFAVTTRQLTHSYGDRLALNRLDLDVKEGEIFALVGPNGGGKSTLFQILSTLLCPTSGSAQVLGIDVVKNPENLRSMIGVVFQVPALDKKLTVWENLLYQGKLYGMGGHGLRERSKTLLEQFGIWDRREDLVATLSGGLQRRVELAKSLLHEPKLLLLDEPTTGLDPLVRSQIWEFLHSLTATLGVTLFFTTHLLEEAEHSSRLALLHEGNLLDQGTPEALKASLGHEIIRLRSEEPERLQQKIEVDLHRKAIRVGQTLYLNTEGGFDLLENLKRFRGELFNSVSIGSPTLEDLFIQRTGQVYDGGTL